MGASPIPAAGSVRAARPIGAKRRLRAGLTLVAGLALWEPGVAPAAQEQPVLSDEARISLLTILPGRNQVYEVFGHTALRVRDPRLGLDIAYNYGTFDFGEDAVDVVAFVARFAYGDLNYKLSAQDAGRLVEWYWSARRRAVVEQVLDLDAPEREAVFRFLQNNARPENAHYRYDFFFDNCATRIVDVLEATVPGLEFAARPPGETLRRLLDPYLGGRPLLHLGMDLGLGIPADREATAREATFLPEHLAVYLASGAVSREGTTRPLVVRTDTLAWSPGAAARPSVPPWPAWLLWILLATVAWITFDEIRGSRASRRWLDASLYGLLGLAGLLLAFLTFVSLHRVTKMNLNLCWALPTHLAVAWLFLRRRQPGWLRPYCLATGLVAVLFLAGWPIWPQDLPGTLLPLLLIVALRSGAVGLGGKT